MRELTKYSEILSEEVAAGLGAFSIDIKFPFFLYQNPVLNFHQNS